MLWGVSTRGYARSLEPLPEAVAVRGIGKSAVSARFVYGTARKLAERMSRDRRALQVVALLIDGVQFGAHVVLAAVGVDAQGAQHVLGLREGATENAAVGRALLADLAERGLATGRSLARRDRGGQSAAPGGGGGVRRAGPASALPRAQETHCYRRPAGAAARFNPQRHESSLRDALTPSAPGASARGSPGGLNISIRAPRPRCARGGRKR
jgi:hypothetical protein